VKVALVVTQMERGGAQAAAIRLAEALRQRGHETEVWFLYRKRPVHDDDPYVRAMLPWPPQGIIDLWFIVRRLYGRLRSFRPDAVVSFTHYANAICQPLALLAGVEGRVASQRNPAQTYPLVARFFDWVWGATAVYKANVAVSQSVAASFQGYPQLYLRRLRVVENGLPALEAQSSSVSFRRRWKIPDDVPLLLSVGRLASQKNHAVLIRALQSVPAAYLVIAGEGPLREKLASLGRSLGVAERVIMPGELPQEEIRLLMSKAAVFLMPSLFEGLSNALLESLQSGMPIIASDIPAISDVLLACGEPAAGRMLPPDDNEAWAASILELCQNQQLRVHLRRRAAEVAGRFSMEKMTDGFEATILEAIKTRRASSGG
jgi:glycosyltransferase involved in cell wall biosynthesis